MAWVILETAQTLPDQASWSGIWATTDQADQLKRNGGDRRAQTHPNLGKSDQRNRGTGAESQV